MNSALKTQIENIFDRAKYEVLALVIAETPIEPQPQSPDARTWTPIDKFADELGLTVAGVMRWVYRSEHPLPCRRFGTKTYIRREEADEWAKAEAAREHTRILQKFKTSSS